MKKTLSLLVLFLLVNSMFVMAETDCGVVCSIGKFLFGDAELRDNLAGKAGENGEVRGVKISSWYGHDFSINDDGEILRAVVGESRSNVLGFLKDGGDNDVVYDKDWNAIGRTESVNSKQYIIYNNPDYISDVRWGEIGNNEGYFWGEEGSRTFQSSEGIEWAENPSGKWSCRECGIIPREVPFIKDSGANTEGSVSLGFESNFQPLVQDEPASDVQTISSTTNEDFRVAPGYARLIFGLAENKEIDQQLLNDFTEQLPEQQRDEWNTYYQSLSSDEQKQAVSLIGEYPESRVGVGQFPPVEYVQVHVENVYVPFKEFYNSLNEFERRKTEDFLTENAAADSMTLFGLNSEIRQKGDVYDSTYVHEPVNLDDPLSVSIGVSTTQLSNYFKRLKNQQTFQEPIQIEGIDDASVSLSVKTISLTCEGGSNCRRSVLEEQLKQIVQNELNLQLSNPIFNCGGEIGDGSCSITLSNDDTLKVRTHYGFEVPEPVVVAQVSQEDGMLQMIAKLGLASVSSEEDLDEISDSSPDWIKKIIEEFKEELAEQAAAQETGDSDLEDELEEEIGGDMPGPDDEQGIPSDEPGDEDLGDADLEAELIEEEPAESEEPEVQISVGRRLRDIVDKGDLGELKTFVTENDVDLKEHYGLIHDAAFYSDEELVQFLLSEGLDPTTKNGRGETALDIAKLENDNPAVIQLLQDAYDEKVALQQRAEELGLRSDASKEDIENFERVLLRSEVQSEETVQPNKDELNAQLRKEFLDRNPNLDRIKELIEQGANAEANMIGSNLDVIKYLVEEHDFDVTYKSRNGHTILHSAASDDNLELVKYLIGQGADINARTTDGFTVISESVITASLETIKYLVNQGARVDSHALNSAVYSNLETFKFIESQEGVDISAVNTRGHNVLYFAAYGGRLDIVKYLVEKHNFDVDSNALSSAIGKERIEVVRYFLSKGAKVSEDDIRKAGSNTEIVTLLQVAQQAAASGGEPEAAVEPVSNIFNVINKDYEEDYKGLVEIEELTLSCTNSNRCNNIFMTPSFKQMLAEMNLDPDEFNFDNINCRENKCTLPVKLDSTIIESVTVALNKQSEGVQIIVGTSSLKEDDEEKEEDPFDKLYEGLIGEPGEEEQQASEPVDEPQEEVGEDDAQSIQLTESLKAIFEKPLITLNEDDTLESLAQEAEESGNEWLANILRSIQPPAPVPELAQPQTPSIDISGKVEFQPGYEFELDGDNYELEKIEGDNVFVKVDGKKQKFSREDWLGRVKLHRMSSVKSFVIFDPTETIGNKLYEPYELPNCIPPVCSYAFRDEDGAVIIFDGIENFRGYVDEEGDIIEVPNDHSSVPKFNEAFRSAVETVKMLEINSLKASEFMQTEFGIKNIDNNLMQSLEETKQSYSTDIGDLDSREKLLQTISEITGESLNALKVLNHQQLLERTESVIEKATPIHEKLITINTATELDPVKSLLDDENKLISTNAEQKSQEIIASYDIDQVGEIYNDDIPIIKEAAEKRLNAIIDEDVGADLDDKELEKLLYDISEPKLAVDASQKANRFHYSETGYHIVADKELEEGLKDSEGRTVSGCNIEKCYQVYKSENGQIIFLDENNLLTGIVADGSFSAVDSNSEIAKEINEEIIPQAIEGKVTIDSFQDSKHNVDDLRKNLNNPNFQISQAARVAIRKIIRDRPENVNNYDEDALKSLIVARKEYNLHPNDNSKRITLIEALAKVSGDKIEDLRVLLSTELKNRANIIGGKAVVAVTSLTKISEGETVKDVMGFVANEDEHVKQQALQKVWELGGIKLNGEYILDPTAEKYSFYKSGQLLDDKAVGDYLNEGNNYERYQQKLDEVVKNNYFPDEIEYGTTSSTEGYVKVTPSGDLLANILNLDDIKAVYQSGNTVMVVNSYSEVIYRSNDGGSTILDAIVDPADDQQDFSLRLAELKNDVVQIQRSKRELVKVNGEIIINDMLYDVNKVLENIGVDISTTDSPKLTEGVTPDKERIIKQIKSTYESQNVPVPKDLEDKDPRTLANMAKDLLRGADLRKASTNLAEKLYDAVTKTNSGYNIAARWGIAISERESSIELNSQIKDRQDGITKIITPVLNVPFNAADAKKTLISILGESARGKVSALDETRLKLLAREINNEEMTVEELKTLRGSVIGGGFEYFNQQSNLNLLRDQASDWHIENPGEMIMRDYTQQVAFRSELAENFRTKRDTSIVTEDNKQALIQMGILNEEGTAFNPGDHVMGDGYTVHVDEKNQINSVEPPRNVRVNPTFNTDTNTWSGLVSGEDVTWVDQDDSRKGYWVVKGVKLHYDGDMTGLSRDVTDVDLIFGEGINDAKGEFRGGEFVLYDKKTMTAWEIEQEGSESKVVGVDWYRTGTMMERITRDAEWISDEAKGYLGGYEVNADGTPKHDADGNIIPNKWRQGVFGITRSLQTIQSWRGLSHLFFGSEGWYNNWVSKVDEEFAKATSEKLTRDACKYDSKRRDKQDGQNSVFIATSSGVYQFVGSIQAERTEATTYLLCSEDQECPNNLDCEDQVCYDNDDKPVKAYQYKISWGVTAPQDVRKTPYVDENGKAVKFNVALTDGDCRNPKAYFYNRPRAEDKEVIELENGASDRDVILDYSPTLYDTACICFSNKYNSKGRADNNPITQICADIAKMKQTKVVYDVSSPKTTTTTAATVERGSIW
jgi:ankyrin repeat protein